MLLDPGADRGQPRAEVVRDDVVGVADEQRAVAHAREAVDLLDHLRVVVGGQPRLLGTALGHRQPAHEVGQERVGRALELGVLVQVVVELPRLVADPQVVVALAHDVVEEHEVGEQDLVHPAPGLEGVELVPVRLGGDVPRLEREVPARRVDALAAALEHVGDRLLRQPLDLELRLERAQLLCDRDVAPRVAEPDRGGHVERALGAPDRAAERRAARGPLPRALAEVAQHQVERHGVAGVRAVADALELDELGARRRRERGAAVGRDEVVLVALGHEQRAVEAAEQLADRRLVGAGRADREGERLRVALEAPADAVLELLRRVRLRIAAAEEELEVAAEVLRPVVAVRLLPALVGRARLVERVAGALGQRRRQRQRRGHEHRAGHALGVLGGEHERAGRTGAVGDEHAAAGAGRVEHREGVVGVGPRAVVGAAVRAVGAPVAAWVERDHPEVPGEVRHLELPEPRVRDRPGRQQQERLLAFAEHLIRDADTAGLGEAGRGGGERARGRLRGVFDEGHRFRSSRASSWSFDRPKIMLESRRCQASSTSAPFAVRRRACGSSTRRARCCWRAGSAARARARCPTRPACRSRSSTTTSAASRHSWSRCSSARTPSCSSASARSSRGPGRWRRSGAPPATSSTRTSAPATCACCGSCGRRGSPTRISRRRGARRRPAGATC